MLEMTIRQRALHVMLIIVYLSSPAISFAARQDTFPRDVAEELRLRIETERQAEIAEMWETGKFEKDSSGMIPISVLVQGRTLAGPVTLDPLRRGECVVQPSGTP